MEKNWTDELETPCIVIDKKKTVENIKKMQMALDGCQCKLRPHIKTHKMPFFAKLQLQYGASGITCAKVSEAEVMAAGGLDDIFIAYPMVGDFRVRRAIALTRRIKRLILAVDSLECAQALQNSAMKESVVLEVRLEVDTGARRTGVLRHEAAVLAKKISLMKNLRLTGIYTFKSLVYHDNPTTDKEIAGEEEGKIMQKIAEAIRAEGIEITDVSAGSTQRVLLSPEPAW